MDRGFTLLELAIVLFILTLLVGRFALPLAGQREVQKWRQAEAEMAEIRAALLGYAALHGYLPCPDTGGDGLAAAGCASSGVEGRLPFKTLGLMRGSDPWGQSWRYRVDRRFADPAAPIALDTLFADALQVFNLQGEKLTTDDERPVFILVSPGANAHPDGDNAVAGDRYQSGPPTADFDDVLTWLARPALLNHLIAAGRGR
ncbi:MAG: type II secretion system GspH family protein [Zoogloeaceae bacterium]|jgi:prepilin-type N-terminal cleavage/methylation domain-containing protein|nr:type II secretion system GspH family protein [Zoogloeaceae bacterium]